MRESGILLRARIEGLTAESRDRTRFIGDEDKIKVQRDAGVKDDTGDKGVWQTWADRVRVWAAWLTDHAFRWCCCLHLELEITSISTSCLEVPLFGVLELLEEYSKLDNVWEVCFRVRACNQTLL